VSEVPSRRPAAAASLGICVEFDSQPATWDEHMHVTGAQNLEVDERRRSVRRRITLIVIIALVVAAGAAIWAARSPSAGHRLIYTETLPDGRVFQCFSDGAFIGSAGTEVEGGEAPPAPAGSEGGPALVVRPPDYTEEEARRAMEEYKKSGRSLEQDQADFDRLSAECRRRR
jgi:hypothetical protein